MRRCFTGSLCGREAVSEKGGTSPSLLRQGGDPAGHSPYNSGEGAQQGVQPGCTHWCRAGVCALVLGADNTWLKSQDRTLLCYSLE